MAPPTKSTKQATKGAKQIVEDNVSTLNFYRNMVLIASTIYLLVMSAFSEFTTWYTLFTIFSGLTHAAAYQFMAYMANSKYSADGKLLDSGTDLNMEGGIAEHVKDLIILTSGVQILSLLSSYFLLLWLLAPIRAMWILWQKLLGPWFFAEPTAPTEMDEKKQRKLERKAKRMQKQ